jgi:hypothetical protein
MCDSVPRRLGKLIIDSEEVLSQILKVVLLFFPVCLPCAYKLMLASVSLVHISGAAKCVAEFMMMEQYLV